MCRTWHQVMMLFFFYWSNYDRRTWKLTRTESQTKRTKRTNSRMRQLNDMPIIIMIVVLSFQILTNATSQHLCARFRASPCNWTIIKRILKLDHLFIYKKSSYFFLTLFYSLALSLSLSVFRSVQSVSFHFPEENLVFAKINYKQNLEHSAESCLHKTLRDENAKEGPKNIYTFKKGKKVTVEQKKKTDRERDTEKERIKLCRWDFCAVLMHFVYCILVCMARTIVCHTTATLKFSFSQSRISFLLVLLSLFILSLSLSLTFPHFTTLRLGKVKKKQKWYAHAKTIRAKTSFPSLHNCKCFIHSVFYFSLVWSFISYCLLQIFYTNSVSFHFACLHCLSSLITFFRTFPV